MDNGAATWLTAFASTLTAIFSFLGGDAFQGFLALIISLLSGTTT